MKSRWKRNAVVAAMVVLVGAAAALNWRYGSLAGGSLAGGSLTGISDTGADSDTAQEAGTKLLGEATLVSGQDTAAADGTGTETARNAADASGLAVSGGAAYSGEDYFASARLTRQQARDSAISLLQEAAGQKDADQVVANEASEGIQVLASYTLKEAQIENLVTAKGYQDCVAFMGDNSVSVVVSNGTGELTGEDVARITDIAMSETGLPASGVKILSAG